METELKQITKLDVSENQIKVIRDKYLKDSPTIEEWLKNVCHNISLAEILHSEKVSQEDIFEDVNFKKFPYNSKGKFANMILLHHGLSGSDKMQSNFNKFLNNLEKLNNQRPEIISETEERFYNLLSSFKFLP
ncbi:MAG: hypothetical protein KKC96_01420, partial [Nanoarchaeota archaeon]|nr:hypothetical protein [Nanoarchaeota archaeon]